MTVYKRGEIYFELDGLGHLLTVKFWRHENGYSCFEVIGTYDAVTGEVIQ